jgi:hypothetical protein
MVIAPIAGYELEEVLPRTLSLILEQDVRIVRVIQIVNNKNFLYGICLPFLKSSFIIYNLIN